jgi:tRNA A-37 threonylcarbamoyl transferase component Bud32
MGATHQLDDYIFYFDDEAKLDAFKPILPRLLGAPETLEGYQPGKARRGKPIHIFQFRLEKTGYFIKWSRSHSPFERLRNFFRQSKARRAWRNAKGLNGLGFDTPVVVGFAERRRFGLVRRSLLITEALPKALPLHAFLYHFCNGRESTKLRHKLTRQLGNLLGRMHQAGVYHADFRAANILVQSDPDGVKLHLVDTEAVVFCETISEERLLRNFKTINLTWARALTTSDRLRVFRAYSDAVGLNRLERKLLLRTTIAACEVSMHHYVGKRRNRALHIASGLDYRNQVKAITAALESRMKERLDSGFAATDLREEIDQ